MSLRLRKECLLFTYVSYRELAFLGPWGSPCELVTSPFCPGSPAAFGRPWLKPSKRPCIKKKSNVFSEILISLLWAAVGFDWKLNLSPRALHYVSVIEMGLNKSHLIPWQALPVLNRLLSWGQGFELGGGAGPLNPTLAGCDLLQP